MLPLSDTGVEELGEVFVSNKFCVDPIGAADIYTTMFKAAFLGVASKVRKFEEYC